MLRKRAVDRPLRRDVRSLGRILGEVLIEQEGEPLYALEERGDAADDERIDRALLLTLKGISAGMRNTG